MKELQTLHGAIRLPAFFPDATKGSVKAVDSTDLEGIHVKGLVVNTYHLFSCANLISQIGGIHTFMNWQHPVISDSGGFQVMSLIREDESYGVIRDDRVIFRTESGRKWILSPEKSIQLQLKLGADILVCLDDCTHPEDPFTEQEKSVERTIAWAKRSKDEYTRRTEHLREKPLLFAIIQGGREKSLRERCARALLEIGFDGYGFGGYPVDDEGTLLEEILEFTASLMPDDKPKYALGIGKPSDIVKCFRMGYLLFDCVLPTRDARHKRLVVFREGVKADDVRDGEDFYDYLYYDNEKFMKDNTPISLRCDCLACKHYTRAYLYHLFKQKDPLALRLATIHNVRFYTQLMEMFREISLGV